MQPEAPWLGLLGMGGIGKTTAAKLLFDHLRETKSSLSGCFLRDIQDTYKGPEQLEEELWLRLTGRKPLPYQGELHAPHPSVQLLWRTPRRSSGIYLYSCAEAKPLSNALAGKAVLLVLDDINRRFISPLLDLRKLGNIVLHWGEEEREEKAV